jgi:hypothetical protein
MKFRRKKHQVAPRIEASFLGDLGSIEELAALDEEALEAELRNAENVESYLRSVAAGHRDGDPKSESMADLIDRGASYSRLARESITIMIAARARWAGLAPGDPPVPE